MKTLLLFLTAGLASAWAQVKEPVAPEKPAAPTSIDFSSLGRVVSISLDARETATKKTTVHRWESGYGSYDRDFARGKTLGIDLANIGTAALPGELALEVLWFSQKLSNKSVGLFYRETIPVKFTASKVSKYFAEMPTLESRELKYITIRERWVSGAKVFGWSVILRASDKAAAFRASSPSISSIVGDQAKLTAILEEYEREISTRPPERETGIRLR